jgi:phosphoserine phosphatase
MHRVSFFLLFRKKKSSQLVRLAGQFVEAHLVPLLRPSILVELERAKEQEDVVLLFSSSPAFLVKCVAQKLGIEYWLGSEYQENNQGDLVHLKTVVDGKKKLEALQQFIAGRGETLSDVTAYSDSIADLPLLMAVSHPVVVAPNCRLQEVARQNGWEIMPS